MDNDTVIPVTGGDDHKEFMQQWLDSNESTSVDFARTCAGVRGIDRGEGFASRFYSTCLRGFQQLCRQKQNEYAHGSGSYILKEELDKLYLWGESFGPGELDKALAESEEIRDNVLDLLVNLGELVICELRASSTVARTGQFHELDSFIEQARLIMSDVEGQLDLDALASDAKCLNRDDYSDDDGPNFYKDVVFAIECLMELSPSLEQNLASAGRSDLSISKSSFDLFYLSGPARFYVSLLRDKFKQASKELVERLGEANWQRHVKVRNMMEYPENNPTKGQETARSVFQPDTTFHDSGIGTSVPARTQYAPSHTSFRTSNTEGGLRSLRVPPTPLEATHGKPFRCYLCGDMLSTIRTRTQWKMHVFGDLMPYICTFDGCQHKLRCFPSRSAWANHEFQEHRFDRYWACPECSKKSCSTLDWEHHLNNVHNQKFPGPNLVAARNAACRISPKRAEEEECPLCRVVLGKPRRAFVKHVSRHMEDIALMALPSNAEEDSEIGSISTNPNSNEDNDTSKDLHINEEYTIKCICGFEDDDENTVYCEGCDTWQHTQCYYFNENGLVPAWVLSSVDHFCAECKPRSLDIRAAIERQKNRRAQIGPDSLLMQPNEQQSNAPPAKPAARTMSPYDTSDGLIRESPQVERSPLTDYLPLFEMSPTPERMSRSKVKEGRERRRRPKAQATQGDAVLIEFMGGPNHPDLAIKASEELSPQESEDSTDKDEVGSENGSDPTQLLRTAVPGVESGTSPRDYQDGPSSDENTEAPHLETLNPVDPFVKQAGMPVDGDLQVLGPQELVKGARRRRRHLTAEGREHAKEVRKVQACANCRRRKIKCKHWRLHQSQKFTKSLPSLTSSTVSVKNPLSQSHQTTESPHEALDNPTEPLNIGPSQDLSRKAINDRLPPPPIIQPSDKEPPSKGE